MTKCCFILRWIRLFIEFIVFFVRRCPFDLIIKKLHLNNVGRNWFYWSVDVVIRTFLGEDRVMGE